MSANRRVQGAVAALAAGLIVLAGGVAQGQQAVAGQPGHAAVQQEPEIVVRSVEMDRSTVRVSGLATVPVRITVKAVRTGPQEPTEADGIWVSLTRTGGEAPGPDAPNGRTVELKRTAGTPRDGTFSGTARIASTMNGTFAVTRVYPWLDVSGGGQLPEPAEVDGPKLTVVGTHIPRLTLTTTPSPVPVEASVFRLTGTLTDRDTGKGYGKPVKVAIGLDNVCVESFPGQTAWADAARGAFFVRRGGDAKNWLNCAGISAGPDWGDAIVHLGMRVQLRPWVSAKAGPAGRVGEAVQVTGSVGGAPQCRVQLRRKDPTGWTGEATARVRESGRYTLTAHPPRTNVTYKVSFHRCYEYVAADSAPFVIRARAR